MRRNTRVAPVERRHRIRHWQKRGVPREHLADALDAEELDNLPPHRIHYEGDIDDHGETVAGAWNIVAWDDAADDDDVARGTWSARRASYEPDAV